MPPSESSTTSLNAPPKSGIPIVINKSVDSLGFIPSANFAVSLKNSLLPTVPSFTPRYTPPAVSPLYLTPLKAPSANTISAVSVCAEFRSVPVSAKAKPAPVAVIINIARNAISNFLIFMFFLLDLFFPFY